MRKTEIMNLEIEPLENAGCNNGNYPRWTGEIEGKKVFGITCNCQKGCSNTDHIAIIDGRDYLIED